MNPDLDDTVVRPHRSHDDAVEIVPDLEDTVDTSLVAQPDHDLDDSVQRPVTEPLLMAATPELVEPGRNPPPAVGSAILDVSDNIWSEPLPEKPLPFRILLDDGTLVPLDEPVYLGRRPSVPRIHPGGVPLLVTVDSPLREVSSTHLELTTIGGAVVASDLRSANGSIVHVPGAAPHTLLGGESVVVTPGTVIELGDGNSIEVLAPDH